MTLLSSRRRIVSYSDAPGVSSPAGPLGVRPGVWALSLFLFAVFFIAVQDLDSPRMWQDEGDADIAGWVGRVEEGRSSRQVGFLMLALFGAAGVVLPSRHDRACRPNPTLLYPLVALVAWAYLSLLWSHDRPLTLKRLVIFTGLWLSVVTLVKHFRLRDAVFATSVYGVLSLLVGVYAEGRAGFAFGQYNYRWAGAMHPNHTATTMGLLVLSMLYFTTTRRTFGASCGCLLIACVAFLVLLATKSRTALAATLVGCGVFVLLRATPRRAVLLTAAGAAAAVVGTFLYQTHLLGPVWEALLMGRKESDVTTLTGRTAIWGFAYDQLMDDPSRLLMGFGHDSFWTAAKTDAVSRMSGFTISEAHNAYLEATLNLGLVGVGLFVACLLGGAARWLAVGRTRLRRYPADAAFALGLVALAAVHGLVESTMTHAQFWTLLLFTCVLRAALGPRREALVADEEEVSR